MSDIYTMTTESLVENANVVKDALLLALEKEGLLKASAEEIGSKYGVLMTKPSWWGRFNKYFTKREENRLHIRIVKLAD